MPISRKRSLSENDLLLFEPKVYNNTLSWSAVTSHILSSIEEMESEDTPNEEEELGERFTRLSHRIQSVSRSTSTNTGQAPQ